MQGNFRGLYKNRKTIVIYSMNLAVIIIIITYYSANHKCIMHWDYL